MNKEPWPLDRRQQFTQLRHLINECAAIHGSGAAERMNRIHKLTEELTRDHFEPPIAESFMSWLQKQAVGE